MISKRRNSKRTLRREAFFVFSLLTAVMILLFSGCAGILPGTGGDAAESGDAREQQDVQEQQTEKESSAVTVREVESALMQLTIQMNAESEFEDYSRGAVEFEESLAMLFLLDRGPDPEDQGVLRAVYKETGEVYHEYTRALVDTADAETAVAENEDAEAADAEAAEDYRLWRFVHTVEGESFTFDVLVDNNRIPREILYEDPYTGEKTQRATRFDEVIKQAEDTSTRAEVLRSLERQKREEMRAELPAYYRELEIIGEETIEQAGRTLDAVHLSRKLGAEFGGDLHVWYSREVPGRIIRVRIGEDIPKVGVEKWEVKL